MIIKSHFKEAIADCETIFFPTCTKKGMKCFRVDQGKLYEFDGKEWVSIPVPFGKMWLNPHTRTMMINRLVGGWKPLKSLQTS